MHIDPELVWVLEKKQFQGCCVLLFCLSDSVRVCFVTSPSSDGFIGALHLCLPINATSFSLLSNSMYRAHTEHCQKDVCRHGSPECWVVPLSCYCMSTYLKVYVEKENDVHISHLHDFYQIALLQHIKSLPESFYWVNA